MNGFSESRKVKSVALFVIGLMLTITCLTYVPIHPVSAPSPTTDGNIVWSKTSTSTNGVATAVAVDGTGVYVVGFNQSAARRDWRIEKRSLTTGALITTFGTGGIVTEIVDHSAGEASSVAVDGTGVYVVGYDTAFSGVLQREWRIEKRSLTTGALITTFGTSGVVTSDPSQRDDEAIGVAVDATGMYVVGYDQVPVSIEWRVEKRSLTTGALIPTFGTGGVVTSDPSAGADEARGVVVDGTGVYVVGYDFNGAGGLADYEWRIEKRSLTSGALIGAITDNPSGGDDEATGVAVDSTGAYIVGFDHSPGNYEWRIEKRSLTTGLLILTFGVNGAVVNNLSAGDDQAYGVAVDATGVYVVGYDHFPGNNEWSMVKLTLDTGLPLWAQAENLSPGDDEALGVAVDATGVYVAGYDSSPGANYEWRLEKRNPGAPLWVVPITLYGGWNLISLPVIPLSTKPSDVFAPLIADGTVKVVWSFTGSPTPSWKMYDARKNSGPLTAIGDGMGLWVYMTSPDTLNVEGWVITPAGSPPQYSLVKGWNLVGYKPQPNPTVPETVSAYITSLPLGLVPSYDSSSIWVYDSQHGQYNQGTAVPLFPGQAFWILMLTPATLSPH